MTREQELALEVAHWKDRALVAERRIAAYEKAWYAKKSAVHDLETAHSILMVSAEERREEDAKA